MAKSRKSMQETVNGLQHVNVSELSQSDKDFVNIVRACNGDFDAIQDAWTHYSGVTCTIPYLRVKAKRIGKKYNGVGGAAYSFHNFDKLGRAYTSRTRK